MKLIHFQGLNCYHDCLITLANALGVDYSVAFSRLWAEGGLRYDPICEVFLSRRLEETLESIGMGLNTPRIAKTDLKAGWAETTAGSYVILGMDANLIPWSPLYQLLHGPHYFIVQKGPSESQVCFDPTYGLSGQKLTTEELISNAFALITIKATRAPVPFLDDRHDPLLSQSQEVLKTHPETLHHFLKQSSIWMQSTKKTVLLPAKYVDALLTARYLYRYFLKQRGSSANRTPLLFSQQYYDEWLAVKNGFYKAALLGQNSDAFDEACRRLEGLFEQELELARQINST